MSDIDWMTLLAAVDEQDAEGKAQVLIVVDKWLTEHPGGFDGVLVDVSLCNNLWNKCLSDPDVLDAIEKNTYAPPRLVTAMKTIRKRLDDLKN